MTAADPPWKLLDPHVLHDVKLVGEIVLDPYYDPPWPGAGVWKVDPEGDTPGEQQVSTDPGPAAQ